MMEKKSVKKIINHALNPHKKSFIDNHIMHPEREWFIGVVISLVVIIVSGSFIYHYYILYSTVSIENGAGVENPIVYRDSIVEGALNVFGAREEVYNSIKSGAVFENEIPALEAFAESENATSTDSDILQNDNSFSTSTNEIRPDRSTEVPYPENQIDPETNVGTSSGVIDLIGEE